MAWPHLIVRHHGPVPMFAECGQRAGHHDLAERVTVLGDLTWDCAAGGPNTAFACASGPRCPPSPPPRREVRATDAVLVGLRALLLRVVGREADRLGLSRRELHGVAGLRVGSLDDGTASVPELRDALRVLRRLHRVRP